MAQILGAHLGHGQTIERLCLAIGKKALAPSYLFVGPSGVGKKQVALGLAQNLLCSAPERQESSLPQACGVCGDCLRVEKRQHESLLLVEEAGPQIKIEKSREVLRYLSLRSYSSYRVVILDDVQKMNPQAANALLKVLEEPPFGTHFFLISPQRAGLLPTILSRCQTVRFSPLKDEELTRVVQYQLDLQLENGDRESLQPWMIRAAQGRPEQALRLMDSEMEQLRRQSFKVWERLWGQGPVAAFHPIKDVVRDINRALAVVAFWLEILRDAMYFQKQIPGRLHEDYQDLSERLGGLSMKNLFDLAERVKGIEQGLKGHLDRGLTFENFCYQAECVIRRMP